MELKKTSFLLKDIEKEWWMKVKIEALKQDKTLREFVIMSLETMLEVFPNGGN